jgi:DNA-binding winged helix-turn-helix (wHTH) protein/TolB-like protein/Tfp pilus assembly protein PilF
MGANGAAKRLFQFGHFLLDPAERKLLAKGEVVPLTPKAFDALCILVEQHGRLVEKDELMKRLWPDTFVEEVTLAHIISDLRKALKERDSADKYIETVPKHGYRFVASVSEIWDEPIDPIVTNSAQARLVGEEEVSIEDNASQSLTPPTAVAAVHQTAKWRTKATFLATGLVLLGLIALLSFAWPVGRVHLSSSGLKFKTLAVLPFKPLNDVGGDEYLGLGITDTLITKLSNVRQIIVRPTSAVQKYATQGFDPVAVGKEQKVEAVLEGSVQRLGDKVRVTVRLLDAQGGAPLWAYQCDEYCTDIFAMQDAVSEQVAMALLAQLSGEEKQRLAKHETSSAAAYQLYLKGRYLWNRRNAEGLKKSIEYFEQALAQDPRYARAFAGLSDSYLLLWGYGLMPPAVAIPKVKAAALKALEIDGTLAEAHLSLGAVAWNYDWDWAGAEREFRRAIELNPHYATAHHYLGEFLTYLGRFDEGWTEIERALEIDPTSLIINTDAGLVLDYARRNDQAIEQYRKALELDPNFRKARRCLAWSYMTKGRFEAAQAEVEKFRQLDDSPGKADSLMLMGDLHTFSERKAEARKVYDEVKRLAAQSYVDPGLLMWIHIRLGEKDQAFAWMERAFAERSTSLTAIKVNRGFDSLRSDPRFHDLLRRMRLTE